MVDKKLTCAKENSSAQLYNIEKSGNSEVKYPTVVKQSILYK